MPKLQAKRIGLPLHRRWIADMLHFASFVPVVAAERTLRLKPLANCPAKLQDSAELEFATGEGLGHHSTTSASHAADLHAVARGPLGRGRS